MKKLILSFFLLLFLFCSISAQKKYTYLKGQYSHFNGEFNEPRYIDIDSISDVYYSSASYADPSIIIQTPAEALSEFIPRRLKYTLIKKSSDGLTDSLKTYTIENSYLFQYTECIKKYSAERFLTYSLNTNHTTIIDSTQNKYEYDKEGRISGILKINSNGRTIISDTTVFNYNLKQFTPEIQYSTIYKNSDSIMVFYNDSGFVTIQKFPGVLSIPPHIVTAQYIFDSQGRMIKGIGKTEVLPEAPRSLASSLIVEYKYTDNGYVEYENGFKKREYKFQSDGYCTDFIEYERTDQSAYPPVYKIVSIEKFSYFKNGEVIVDNESFENVAPKVYGVQGGVVVNTEKSLPVSIYSLSGSIVKQEKVFKGNVTIPLPKGLYIVVIGNMSYKVLIR